MIRNRYYNIAYVAIFGALWGVIEATFGTLLHAVNLPFKGTLLTALGTVVVLAGARFMPGRKGLPLINMGIIAVLIKTASGGIIKANMLLSIFLEAALRQTGVSTAGYNPVGYMLAGILACIWPLISRMFVYGLLFGQGFRMIYLETIRSGSKALGISLQRGITVLGIMMGIHVIIGAFAGLAAWVITSRIIKKKNRPV